MSLQINKISGYEKHFLNSFQEKVAQQGDALALVLGSHSLTYKDLNTQSNHLAHYLCSQGVGPHTIVGLYIERSFDLIVGILAIIKAGGAYLPLDLSYPEQRVKQMIDASGINILLTQESILKTKAFSQIIHTVCIDAVDKHIQKNSDHQLPTATTGDDLGYVVYTSGSTGTPKGIAMPIRALSNLIDWQIKELCSIQYDRVLQFSPISFDVSFQEIFVTLCAGKTLYLIKDEERKDPFSLLAMIQDKKIDIISLPYVAVKQLIDAAHSQGQYPDSLKMIITSGEQLKITESIKKFFNQLPSCRLCNQYGPSESHVVTSYLLPDKPDTWDLISPIGKPIANTRIYLLDSKFTPVSPGEPGEIFIEGICLANGYLNRDDLSRDSFLVIDIDGTKKRVYKTGDLAQYSHDGNLMFLGRIDNQVKIRGYRIEVGELESILSEHPAVKDVVVKVIDIDDHRRLVAYLEMRDNSVNMDEMSVFLADRVPTYMLPSFFVPVKTFPLTPSGKVDRNSLDSIEIRGIHQNKSFIQAQTNTEMIMARIWSDILGVKMISKNDDFFKIGGCSLLATRLAIKVREQFDVDVQGFDVFNDQTLEKFSSLIDMKKEQTHDRMEMIRPVEQEQAIPLSLQQQQLWIISKLDPDNFAYHETFSIFFHSEINHPVLLKSINKVLSRHDILRTSFNEVDSYPVQTIHQDVHLDLDHLDLIQYPEADREYILNDRLDNLVKKPFDLEEPSLLRGVFVKYGENDDRLYWVVHHIIFDGESYLIFMHELEKCYTNYLGSDESLLIEPRIQFADFACWQRNEEQNKDRGHEEAYWQKQLVDLPQLQLPTDRSYPEAPTLSGSVKHFEFDKNQVEGIKRLTQEYDMTLFVMLMSAFITLLYRYTGQYDIPLATVMTKRDQPHMEHLIGYLIDSLILRTDLVGISDFIDVANRVRSVCKEAYAHHNIPFEKLVKIVNPDRRLGQRGNPLAQVAFTVEPDPKLFPKSDLGWDFKHMAFHSGNVKYDLYFELEQKGEGLIGRVEYSTELFDDQTIDRMIGHYLELINAIILDPQQPIDTIDFMTGNEKFQLEQWSTINHNQVPSLSVKELVEEQCQKNPHNIAISCEGESITYLKLNEKSNQLAWYLQSNGVTTNDIVAVSMERSIDLIIGILAIVKTGAAFVSLDPTYPSARLDYMLNDTNSRILITHSKLKDCFEHDAKREFLFFDCFDFDNKNKHNLPSSSRAEDVFYIVYTSGSTGKPKGIKITNEGIVKMAINSDYIDIKPNDIVAQLNNASFDGFAFELWGTLLNGLKLVIVPKLILLSPHQLKDFILLEHITIMVFPTPLFNLVSKDEPDMFKTTRYVIAGGDKIDLNSIELILAAGKPEHLINIYGPAESTTFATFYDVQDHDKERVNIPIGRPIAHTQIYILDKNLQKMPIGVMGEICIGGDLLAAGYLNNEELSDELFIDHPFIRGKGKKIYRTRDLGRYLPDGNIEISSRIDTQIKIRGFRVELDEIYSALYAHPMIKQVYITKGINAIGQAYLIAYCVMKEQHETCLSSYEVKCFLKDKLPEFMIPSKVVMLPILPLNENGKVDLRYLTITQEDDHPQNLNVPPKTSTERHIIAHIAKLLSLDELIIGMQDNFFDLGGNSLLAVQLISNIGKTLKQPIAFSVVFNTSTIQQLSDNIVASLHVSEENSDMRLLTKMHEGKPTKPIIFFAPPAGGQIMVYQHLMRHLDPELSIYGFRSSGLENGEDLFLSVEEMANNYLGLMEKIQPEGPYYLIGASAGGLIVYEMAQQLMENGEQVALLALIDSPDPLKMVEFQSDLDILQFFCGTIFQMPIESKIMLKLNEIERLDFILDHAKRNHFLPTNYQVEHLHRLFSVFSANAYAIARYKPKPFSGLCWYIKAEEKSSLVDFEHELIWGSLCQRFRLKISPGDHMTLLEEPNVDILAKYIEEALQAASYYSPRQ